MQTFLNEIATLASGAGTEPTETAIPGVVIIKGEVPQHQLAALYEPMIGFVVQGAKRISVGDRTVHAKAPSYFVVPTEVPATGQVFQGRNLPYLSVALRLDLQVMMELLKDVPASALPKKTSGEFDACPATPEFAEAWVRLLRLLKTPHDIPALAPVYTREILYRVLRGPQGGRLRKACAGSGKTPGVLKVVQWIRVNYNAAIDVEPLAKKAGMGVTTFHRGFRQVTGMSPIQFQKQIRLLEARKLIGFGGKSVSESAFEVGYESLSQFSREYSRHFGSPPSRDIVPSYGGAGF